jgi:hypothetical protein
MTKARENKHTFGILRMKLFDVCLNKFLNNEILPNKSAADF